MNNRPLLQALAVGTVVLAAAAAIAIGAYNAGLSYGLAEGARAVAAAPAGAPLYPYGWGRPWGFGFFPVFPFFFLLFFFFVLRGVFWRGPWRGACHHQDQPQASKPANGATT